MAKSTVDARNTTVKKPTIRYVIFHEFFTDLEKYHVICYISICITTVKCLNPKIKMDTIKAYYINKDKYLALLRDIDLKTWMEHRKNLNLNTKKINIQFSKKMQNDEKYVL